MVAGEVGRWQRLWNEEREFPVSPPLPHPSLSLALSVDAREDWGLPRSCPPGQAWVGSSAEFWERLLELGTVSAISGQGGKFTALRAYLCGPSIL